MKILHTSDWHIGSQICTKKRYREHKLFFDWLISLIEQEGVDVLIVAGDVFDSGIPSNRALDLYYSFLGRVARSSCSHVIITAGNHDSPSLINATRELCAQLNITVIGSLPENPEKIIREIKGVDGKPGVIVCPVPFLRDQDIRTADIGETPDEKAANTRKAIETVYRRIGDAALEIRQHLGEEVPIIATGHLYTRGGLILEDDGRRDLSVGTLGAVGVEVFPDCIDYLALGHLHLPQKVNGCDTCRYSGAPLTMGFGEAGKQKSVSIIETGSGRALHVREVQVPVFQRLCVVKGPIEEVTARIRDAAASGDSVWIDVILDDPRILPDADRQVRALTHRSAAEVLRVRSRAVAEQYMIQADAGESLQDLDPLEVFSRKMDACEVPETQREELTKTFCEVLAAMTEEDANEE